MDVTQRRERQQPKKEVYLPGTSVVSSPPGKGACGLFTFQPARHINFWVVASHVAPLHGAAIRALVSFTDKTGSRTNKGTRSRHINATTIGSF